MKKLFDKIKFTALAFLISLNSLFLSKGYSEKQDNETINAFAFYEFKQEEQNFLFQFMKCRLYIYRIITFLNSRYWPYNYDKLLRDALEKVLQIDMDVSAPHIPLLPSDELQKLPFYDLVGKLFHQLEELQSDEIRSWAKKAEDDKIEILNEMIKDFQKRLNNVEEFEEDTLNILLEDVFNQIKHIGHLPNLLETLSLMGVNQRDYINFLSKFNSVKIDKKQEAAIPAMLFLSELQHYKKLVSENYDVLKEIEKIANNGFIIENERIKTFSQLVSFIENFKKLKKTTIHDTDL